jgi:hypothetical protein
MTKNRPQRLLTALLVGLSLVLFVGAAAAAPKKASHHNGKQLLGEKIKTKGSHQIDKKGDYTVAADVKDGKIAGVKVKHAKKGDVAVKKYKTNKKLAQVDGVESPSVPADEYMGTVWIGYAYYDDYGNEEIYWFPYDMIYDGDTGAVEYVPAA